jgi:hypothetical protein
MTQTNITPESELPNENAWGEEIDWVWVVYRPANTSELGREELLGVHDNPNSARKHAQAASRQGACAVKEMAVQDGEHPLESDECE